MNNLIYAVMICFSLVASRAMSFACVDGTLYLQNDDTKYVGSNSCDSAHIGNAYACVDGTLYLQNGSTKYVGSTSCTSAKVAGSYACVDGTL